MTGRGDMMGGWTGRATRAAAPVKCSGLASGPLLIIECATRVLRWFGCVACGLQCSGLVAGSYSGPGVRNRTRVAYLINHGVIFVILARRWLDLLIPPKTGQTRKKN